MIISNMLPHLLEVTGCPLKKWVCDALCLLSGVSRVVESMVIVTHLSHSLTF